MGSWFMEDSELIDWEEAEGLKSDWAEPEGVVKIFVVEDVVVVDFALGTAGVFRGSGEGGD